MQLSLVGLGVWMAVAICWVLGCSRSTRQDASDAGLALVPSAEAPVALRPMATGKPGAAPSHATPEPHLVELAKKVAQLQKRLEEQDIFVLSSGHPVELVVAAPARPILSELKDAVLALLEAGLPTIVAAPPADDPVRSTLAAGGVAQAGDASPGVRVDIDASLHAAPGHRDRWVIPVCIVIGVPGSDCMLAVYERRNGKFRQALIVRSDDYSSVRKVHFGADWAISPPDDWDHYYVVAAWTHPWLTSSWRAFEYAAFAPSADPRRPKLLARGAGDAFWVNGFHIDAGIEGFAVAFTVWNKAENALAPRVHEWTMKEGSFRLTRQGGPLP